MAKKKKKFEGEEKTYHKGHLELDHSHQEEHMQLDLME